MAPKDDFSSEALRFFVILGSTFVIIVVIELILVGYNVDWTGFNLHAGPHGQPYQPAKTLWDWMQLLIVPAVLAGGGFSITYLRDRNERKITTDRLQAASLQEYLNRMSELLLKENLRKSESYAEVRHVARAQTLTVLRGLDPVRKGSLIQFLHESSLIKISATNSIIDLSIIDLKGVDLSGADFRQINLSGANLSGVNLSESNLARANLSGADFSGANLSGAYLWAADLRNTNLKGTNLCRAKLREANLEGASLHEANLRLADLSGINLSGADLSKVDLSMAIVHRFEMFFIPVANRMIPFFFPLKQANLSGTNLREAKLTYASLRRVNLSKATLDRADINEANLREANLSKANLNEANLSKSKLRKTNLSKANLSKANLSRANLHGVDLRGANLQDATGVAIERLKKEAKSLEGATMPDGSRYP